MKSRGSLRLAEWLKTNGLTQEAFAEKLGTHQTNVSAWLLGARAISLKNAVAIACVTGIPVEEWTISDEESGPALPSVSRTG